MVINGRSIKGAIFDMDGVILDSLSIWTDMAGRFAEKYGHEAFEEFSKAVFSMSIEQGVELFKERYGSDQASGEILQEIQDFIRDGYAAVKLKNGAKDLMESLSAEGIKITAATSNFREPVQKALERNGLSGYVDRIFTSTEVGSSKHDPEIYDLAAAHMGTIPEETIVFEDSLYALKTAKAAGYHTAGIYDAFGEPDQDGLKAEAEFYVNDPAEFLNKYLIPK